MKKNFLYSLNLEYLEKKYADNVNNNELNKILNEQFSESQSPVSSISNITDTSNIITKKYRTVGFRYANINPISTISDSIDSKNNKELDSKLQYEDVLSSVTNNNTMSLETLKNIYCGSIGFELQHIENQEIQKWLIGKIEDNINWRNNIKVEDKKDIFEILMKNKVQEEFIHKKFIGAKRFSSEGLEGSFVLLKYLQYNLMELEYEHLIICNAHRGRLNTLTNIANKPYRQLFAEFKDINYRSSNNTFSGDVKYHLGYECEIQNTKNKDKNTDKKFTISLCYNSSHLESINPVGLGKTRAIQDYYPDESRNKVANIIMHGDASFSGQGIVYESITMEYLPDYESGGAIHIIMNNQVGFTATPENTRVDNLFATSLAKAFDAPIIHVNSDDPEAMLFIAKLAIDFKYKFKKSIFIEIIGYRKYGHNESDEPRFTQPKMYSIIDKIEDIRTSYKNKLIKEEILSIEETKKLEDGFINILEDEFIKAENFPKEYEEKHPILWKDMEYKTDIEGENLKKTGIKIEILRDIAPKITQIPEGFNIHRKIAKFFETRLANIKSGKNIDWCTGEALALATILNDGYPIRFAGEDSKRGTFSQRHAVIFDSQTEEEFTPINNASSKENIKLKMVNSLLSEFGGMGFEYGYSLYNPNSLVLWEAQFGDFANGAQIILDQFISSAESKWLISSGLVLLLPHGFEGQGPEHSSARIERYLQLCAQFNMYIVNCSTPANYFHALRRQLATNYRKPLIVFTPKSLLRHKLAVSNIEEFSENTQFLEIISERDTEISKDENINNIQNIIFCSGKIYYDLVEYRNENNIKNTIIITIEQLYPFPMKGFQNEIKKYSNCIKNIIWCQEEPKNMGAWNYIASKLYDEVDMQDIKIKYVGRKESASPACGSHHRHELEQEEIVKTCFQ